MRKILSLLVVLVGLMIGSCTRDDSIAWRVAANATPAQRAAAVAAAEEWNAFTYPTRRTLIVDDEEADLLIAIVPRCEIPVPGYVPSCAADGSAERGAGIWVADDLSDRNFFRVIRHEFGHSLGLALTPEHLPSPAVMDPYATATEITAIDLEECRRVGSCP